MRTTRNAYPSGWAYKLHYGATEPDPPQTLDDGTIRRYDNSHEDTNGHELHAAPDPEPETIEFPGMVELWDRFWSEIPKDEFEIDCATHTQEKATMTDTPPLHPMEREQLQCESTLVVTVSSSGEFHGDVRNAIQALEGGESVDSTPTISFGSYDELMETLTPRVLDLIEAIRREEPSSINETARVVDRDVKNVHGELSRLAQLGIIYFEEEAQRKRPVVWFDDLIIELPFDPETGGTATAAP